MPERQGILGFGAPVPGRAPYRELADPAPNVIDRWLERRLGALMARLPVRRRVLEQRAIRIEAMAAETAALSDDALRAEAAALRPRLVRSRGDRAAVERAFALVREASARLMDRRQYRVQLMGGLALYDGRMVEMATGEGKTLTGLAPAITAALAGDPVHVVTVNDYLAGRDAAILAPVYDFFGLSHGVIDSDMDTDARRAAYAADITHVSNKNLTFDYLRDRIALGRRRALARRKALALTMGGDPGGGLMLRGLAFAIVDEADSVLVDEARTPLILSASTDDAEAAALYENGLALARQLESGRDFTLDAIARAITLTDAGKARLAALARDLEGLWRIRRAREELARQALAALHVFTQGVDYVLIDGSVQIVDEYTGRVMADRSWQGGLHQMIEAKEGVAISGRKETLARITYQRFFRRYARFAGMTGTGMELAGEFRETFGLATVRIPTHRPRQRRHLGSRFLPDGAARWRAVASAAAAVHATGRPVLIGTRSVEASEQAAAALAAIGLSCRVLNARHDAEEAEIVAGAGTAGAITVATNMAGRGTDIALGPGVRAAGGLHVILTEFHDSSRVDRQLYGRAGRQGDPGSTEAIVALDDDLFRRYVPFLRPLCRGARIGDLARQIAQFRAEADHAATRRSQTAMDRQLERALAFAGPVE